MDCPSSAAAVLVMGLSQCALSPAVAVEIRIKLRRADHAKIRHGVRFLVYAFSRLDRLIPLLVKIKRGIQIEMYNYN